MNQIHFRKIKETYGIFSNFHPTPVNFDGEEYKTSEAAYQAQKYIHLPILMKQIQNISTPKEAADIGRNPLNILRSDWEQQINPSINKVYPGVVLSPDTIEKVKDLVMFDVLCHKAFGSSDFRDLLLSTNDDEIIEQSYSDKYWGNGDDGTGLNRLGKVLMLLRSELRKCSDFETTFDKNLNILFVIKKNSNKIIDGLHLFGAGTKSHVEFYEGNSGCKIVFADGFGLKQYNDVRFHLPVAVNFSLWQFIKNQ